MAAAGTALTSGAITVWNIHIMSLRQSVIPGRLLGRIDLTVPFLLGGGVAFVASLVFFRFLMTLPNAEDVDNGDLPVGPIEPPGITPLQ
ncbi:hypothetical protein GCM10027057_15790 [Marisediminicola antarctica]